MTVTKEKAFVTEMNAVMAGACEFLNSGLHLGSLWRQDPTTLCDT